jgi:hypothetical protein
MRPRRRIQRAFLKWLAGYNQKALHRLVVIKRTDKVVHCQVQGVSSAVNLILTDTLFVSVYRDRDEWDQILWLDCIPMKEGGHYICPFCDRQHRIQWSTRDQFWQAQLFEPLAKWLDKLDETDWLLFYELPGATWVKLHRGALHEAPKSHLMGSEALHARRSRQTKH